MLEITQDGSGACDASNDEYLRFEEHSQSGTAHVLATGRPLVVPDARTSTQIVPGRAAHHGIASSLFVPLSHGGDVRHVIILGWSEPRDITPDDVGTVELAAASAAAGLARLEADERRAAGSIQDRAVVRAASALNACLDLQEILLTVVHEAALALGAEMSGVYLGNAARGRGRDRRLQRPRELARRAHPAPAKAPRAACSRPAGRSSPTTTCATSPSPTSRRRAAA